MIRFTAITAFILATAVLTGCQSMPSTTPSETKVTETHKSAVDSPTAKPEKRLGLPSETAADEGLSPSGEPIPEITIKQTYIQKPRHIDGKLVLGFSEQGTLPELGVTMPAKIDTGAGRTSLDARDIKYFERDGRRWVQFSLNRTSKGVRELELPLQDTVAIKRPGEESLLRPVVSLTVQVGNITQHLNVSLNDRSDFEFPLLIGRDFLQDLAIADVGKSEIAVEKVLKTISRKIPETQLQAIDKTIYQPVDVAGLETFGALEYIKLTGVDSPLQARIDTGAVTSSLDAREVGTFEKNGQPWVRFKLFSGEKPFNLELPVARYALIKRHGDLESQRRPVVKLLVQVGNVKKYAEFTLRDRSSYEYPVLIAEEFLTNTALVDVSQEYIASKPTRGIE